MKKLILLFWVLGFSLNLSFLQAQSTPRLLEALGGSTGLLGYNTYLVIGGEADAYAGECSTSETVLELMREQPDLLC